MVVAGSPKGIMIQVLMTNPKAIERTRRKVQNPRSMLDKLIIIIQQSTDKTFRVGGRPKWEESHRAKVQHGKTLQDEGTLQKSVAVNPIVSVRRNELRYGTKEKKAPSMHFGYPPINNPPRPFLELYDEDMKKIERLIKTDIKKTWAFGSVGVGK